MEQNQHETIIIIQICLRLKQTYFEPELQDAGMDMQYDLPLNRMNPGGTPAHFRENKPRIHYKSTETTQNNSENAKKRIQATIQNV